MQTYLVWNGKGGVGKTTITLTLAAAFSNAGLAVSVLDLDSEQQSSFQAGQRLKELGLANFSVASHPSKLAPCQILLIDTPPQASNATLRTALEFVRQNNQGRIVVAMPPAILDFRATLKALASTALSKDTHCRLLMNRVRTQSTYGKQTAREEFAKNLDIPMLSGFMKERSCYQRLSTEGWSALTKDALAEVDAIKTELMLS